MLVVSGITLAIYLAARAWHDRGWLIRRIEGLDARTKELQATLDSVRNPHEVCYARMDCTIS